jgi:prolycopene isomerase
VVLYLGLKREADQTVRGRTVWYMPEYNVDKVYADILAGKPDLECRSLLAAFPARFDESLAPKGYECVNLFTLAPFMSEQFWKASKEKLLDTLLNRAGHLIPNLRRRIILKEMATPVTIQRYTLNDRGAMYGLASTMSQLRTRVMPQKSVIPGLYLASHWATVGTGQGGTPMAAYAGRNAAGLALSYWRRAGKASISLA